MKQVFAALAATMLCSPALAEPTVKIGVLTELSGAQGTSGQHERNGLLFYLAEHDNKLGGLTAQLVSEDTAGDPAIAIAKVKKLVDSDHVDMLFGPISSASAAAIKSYVIDHKIPLVEAATADEVVDDHWIFRDSFASNPDAYLEGYLAGKAGYKKAVVIASNYLAGQMSVTWFGNGFTAAGGTVAQKLLPRLGTPDYSSFIAQFDPAADVVLAFFPGSDGVRFIRQVADYGGKQALYGYPITVDETLLPAEGKAAIGFVGASIYFSTIDTVENRAFLAKWGSGFNGEDKPSWPSFSGYVGAALMDDAITKARGNLADKDALVTAMANANLSTPAGPALLRRAA